MNFKTDKLEGMFYGCAVGDALGSPHEFKRFTRAEQYTGTIYLPIIITSRWQGKKVGAIGQITDDTELTLILAGTIIKHKGYNRDAVVLAYLGWANAKTPFLGRNTRHLFVGVKTLRGYQKRWDKQFLENPTIAENAQSNGCLMRCSPLALLSDWEKAVELDCSLTNPNRVCVMSCKIYVGSLRDAFKGVPRAAIFANAQARSEHKEVSAVLEQVKRGEARDTTRLKGWVLHALYCAFSALLSGKSFHESMDWVIQKGGDTDTNACIAGGLLGAVLGHEKMALELTTRTNIDLVLAAQVDDGDMSPRPPECHPRVISKLCSTLSTL